MIQSFILNGLVQPEDENPSDEKVWEKVNPAIPNDWWPIENLRRRHKSLPINEFQRYHLNQWTRTEEEKAG